MKFIINNYKIIIFFLAAIFFQSCCSLFYSSLNYNSKVECDCGTDPVLDYLERRLSITGIAGNMQVKINKCIDTDSEVGINVQKFKAKIDAKIKACITKDVTLDPDLKKQYIKQIDETTKYAQINGSILKSQQRYYECRERIYKNEIKKVKTTGALKKGSTNQCCTNKNIDSDLNGLLMSSVQKNDINDVIQIMASEPCPDINFKDKYGDTPLHHAAINNFYDMAKYLLECGANVNIKNNWDQTPIYYAESKGIKFRKMIKLLRSVPPH